MGKLKDLKDKLFGRNKNQKFNVFNQIHNDLFDIEIETNVYYKDLEKQKKEILNQIKLLDEQIEEYRKIGAKDTMNWLLGYKDILNDQLKEIDNTEVKFKEEI